MTLLDFFLPERKNTANIAKRRLQIIIAEQRQDIVVFHHLTKKIRQDILKTICKYVKIDPETMTIRLEKKNENDLIFELSVILKIKK